MEDDLSNQEELEETRRLTKAERKVKRREEKKQEREKQKRRRKLRRAGLWLSVIVIMAAVVGGIIFIVTRDDSAAGSVIGMEAVEGDWTKGSMEASVTLVEYSDFECPACAQFYPMVKGVVEELGNRIQFVYRHFPISQLHKQAELAALAAEAAGRQGKFWEMHDVLFERQDEWAGAGDARDKFGRYAQELALDMERFDVDIEDNELRDKVEEQRLSGVRFGVSGTPTFFLNGEKMEGYNTQDEFKNIVIETVESS